MIKLILGVHPLGGHAAGDRVIGVAHRDFEGVRRTVAGARPLALGRADHMAAVVDRQPIAKSWISPPQSDHLVVGGPILECVIGRVDDRQASSLGNVFFEGLADVRGP